MNQNNHGRKGCPETSRANSRYHHRPLSPPTADCALTRESVFQRARSLLATFNSARSSCDQDEMLSRHRLFGIPLFRFPSTAPSRQIFEWPISKRLICPNDFNTLLLMVDMIGVGLVVFSRSSILIWSKQQEQGRFTEF